jgi:hypothetical protein
MKLRPTSALSRVQSRARGGTRAGTRSGTDSGTNAGGHLQCAVSACGISDPGGAAAARLLFRTTLDPLLGFTAVNRIHTVTKPLLFTEVNI